MNSPIFSLRIPGPQLRRIKAEARRRNQSLSATIKALIDIGLAQQPSSTRDTRSE
jgi:hypothetical protein